MLTIAQGQTGTLTFAPDRVGLTPDQVASVSWQPQGGQQAIKFTPPDKIEGLQPGKGAYKVTATMSAPGEKLSWAFEVLCTAPDYTGLEPVVPVVIFRPVPPAP
jgi:hypothetical protein